MKVTLLFPGQGSQYIGMGTKFLETKYKEYLEQANKTLGFDLSKIMLEGPVEDLTLTQNTQPAIFTYSAILLEQLKEEILAPKYIEIERVLGHSIGEYGALYAASVLNFDDAVKAVHLRGKFMQEAVPAGLGTMYALLKVDPELVAKACVEVTTEECAVIPANFNSPKQTVISGHKEACEKAIDWLKENQEIKFRAVELQVSAPFHSPLIKPAEDRLREEFKSLTFNSNSVPYLANIDATEYSAETSPEIIKENLLKQICGSVQWLQSIQKLPNETVCLEVGPGKVLAGLVKQINPEIKVISLDTLESLSELSELL